MKRKVDWFIHYVPCGRPSFHTHGLDRYGSLELELALPVAPEKGMQLINYIAAQIAWHGMRYTSAEKVCDVLNLPFFLFQTTPVQPSKPDDQVLRILLCDEHLRYPWDEGCDQAIWEQLSEAEREQLLNELRRRYGANGW